MSRANTLFVVGLALGAGLGFLASGRLDTQAPMAGPGADPHDGHHDRLLAVSPPPTIALEVVPEGPCAANVRIRTTNFRFAPEAVNGAHVPGEGHAHIYADDTKLGRVYGAWVHVAAPAGTSELHVTLNSNDHATLADGETPVRASAALNDC